MGQVRRRRGCGPRWSTATWPCSPWPTPTTATRCTLEMTNDLAAAVGWALAEGRRGHRAGRRPAGVLRRRLGRRPARAAGRPARDVRRVPRRGRGTRADRRRGRRRRHRRRGQPAAGVRRGAGVARPLGSIPASSTSACTPVAVTSWRLERRMGRQAAAALVLGGDALDGVEAEAEGPGLALRAVRPSCSTRPSRWPAGPHPARPRSWPGPRPRSTPPRQLATADEAVALELDAQRWSMAQPEFAERLDDLRRRLGRD